MTAKFCDKTIDDLAAEYPRITSVAIVPLGLTRYNTDARLTAVTPEFCRQIIDEVASYSKRLAQATGNNVRFSGRRDLSARRTRSSGAITLWRLSADRRRHRHGPFVQQ